MHAADLTHLPFQLHHCECARHIRNRQTGEHCQFIHMERLGAEMSKNRGLCWVRG